MNIAIIDADIIGKNSHRFPNLACMKLSSFYKREGHGVVLKTDYEGLDAFDKVFISKVFTDTEIPGEPEDKTSKTDETIADWYKDNEFLKRPNIEYGGTGFFFKNAPPLACEIEHSMPDYNLYDAWIAEKIAAGARPAQFKYYTDYSIGFLTRGCFRKCPNCVNEKYSRAFSASPLAEFYDPTRKKICLLDDNFFACKNWRELIQPIKDSGKRFRFKQGLDERLLTPDIVKEIDSWKYEKEFIFAFDNIADKPLILEKLKMLYDTAPYFRHGMKFYVFCGFDRNGKYDTEFWKQDIDSTFERMLNLARFGALSYIMRYEKIYKSEFATFYAAIASWSCQPSFFKKLSFRTFAICRGMTKEGYKKYVNDAMGYIDAGGKKGASWRAMEQIEAQFPDVARKYFDTIPADIWGVDAQKERHKEE